MPKRYFLAKFGYQHTTLAGFLVGCAILVASFGIGWADWGNLANQIIVVQTLMGASIAALAFLVIMAVLSKGRDTWRAMAFGSILLLLGLVVFLVDIGILFAPIPMVLLFYSLSKLRKEPA